MLRSDLDFQAQLRSTREAAIQAIESRPRLPLPKNHPINMIVDGMSLHELFKQRGRFELAAYVESEYGAFPEEKAVITTGYTVEQGKEDILSIDRRTQVQGFFHLAYFGEYNYLHTQVVAIKEVVQDQKTVTNNLIIKKAIAEGAAIAGHVEVVFAILESEEKSAPDPKIVKSVFLGAARGGQSTLLCKLMRKHKGYEEIIVRGFRQGGFLGEESSSQLVSILYFLEEQGRSLLDAMRVSSSLPSAVKDNLSLLRLPTRFDHGGFLSAKIMLRFPQETERMKLVVAELQDTLPRPLIELILQYDFFLQQDADKNCGVLLLEEKKAFAALPIEEQDRVSTAVIRQSLNKTVSRENVMSASIACLRERDKTDFLWAFVFPVWIYKNWDLTKAFFQLVREAADTNRYQIAQQYVTQFPQHLFSRKLKQVTPSINVEPNSNPSVRKSSIL